jgi:hypothetical protein
MREDIERGARVHVDTPTGRAMGTVIRVNKKTVSVALDGATGQYFRASPELVHPIESGTTPRDAASSIELPVAKLRATGTGTVTSFGLSDLVEQWGQFAWHTVEERIVRLMLATLNETSEMVVRCGFGLDKASLLFVIQYSGLSMPFEQAWASTFWDFSPTPRILGQIPIEAGHALLFGALAGRVHVFVGDAAAPVVQGVYFGPTGIEWRKRPFPMDEVVLGDDGSPQVRFTLRKAEAKPADRLAFRRVDRVVRLAVSGVREVDS